MVDPYDGPDRRSDAQPRIDELEAATIRLATQIEGLNTALTRINDISTKQAEMEGKIVPREEIDAQQNKLAEDVVAARDKASARLRQASAMLVLLMLALFIGAAVFFQFYQAKQLTFQQGLYDTCVKRNGQAQAIQTLLANSQAELDAMPPGPAKDTALANYELLKNGFPVVTCPKPQ